MVGPKWWAKIASFFLPTIWSQRLGVVLVCLLVVHSSKEMVQFVFLGALAIAFAFVCVFGQDVLLVLQSTRSKSEGGCLEKWEILEREQS